MTTTAGFPRGGIPVDVSEAPAVVSKNISPTRNDSGWGSFARCDPAMAPQLQIAAEQKKPAGNQIPAGVIAVSSRGYVVVADA